MKKYILSIDQGTTSSRAIIFNKKADLISVSMKEFTQYYPRPGWVEHDAEEIWETQKSVCRNALSKAGLNAADIEAVGITNQRETIVLWDRASGKPVYNAIVWQCRRSTDICRKLKKYETLFKEKTGLLLDPYFSGTKLTWLFENEKTLYKKAVNGELMFGTIDTWLLYNLTGNHYTDPSNASRTLMYNIHTNDWDRELLEILSIPMDILPEVMQSSDNFGLTKKEILGSEIPVTGVAGDQQAALFGQTCFNAGDIKNTYGTGCFALMNTGTRPIVSKNKLLTTTAWKIDGKTEYALEGSVFIGGAVVQWLRDNLKIIKKSEDSEKLALQSEDSGGVYFVPAFTGLGAPYWDPDVRGTLFGITRGTTSSHIARAALESIAFQSYALINAMENDSRNKIESLKVDGGATKNIFLMQFQADILGIPVILSKISETTALGAAYLAGLFCSYWKNRKEILENREEKLIFKPSIRSEKRLKILDNWNKAINTAKQFKL